MDKVPQGVSTLPASNRTHEAEDVNLRSIFFYGVALMVGMGVVFGVVTWMQYAYLGAPPRLAQPPSYTTAPNVTLPPQPRFEEIPGANLEALRTREDVLLDNYGWINQEAGTVRIPIQRAMELLLERGFPVMPEDAENSFEEAGNIKPSYSSSGRATERIDP